MTDFIYNRDLGDESEATDHRSFTPLVNFAGKCVTSDMLREAYMKATNDAPNKWRDLMDVPASNYGEHWD